MAQHGAGDERVADGVHPGLGGGSFKFLHPAAVVGGEEAHEAAGALLGVDLLLEAFFGLSGESRLAEGSVFKVAG